MTGRSAVRLARVLREHEVGGSNPLAPMDLVGSRKVVQLSKSC